ncbi:uncharacterized protein Tco025E_04932 [Trypanosoma conorhini]|uniref:Uncharacterized protein n=1 Tax=Trypanosoma conorhini TaxID=83891 RepID=A0A3R7L6L4_9TRYP|nr:uncharacterized protein Tco025E_04932 [Trypanosoma conorhini]RNF17254.1 hypothetical protein Tco025E_04932 [Trypanosoma conorhini]
MEAVCEGRLQRLEQQLRRYTRAYDAQRELLFRLYTQLPAAEAADDAVPGEGVTDTARRPEGSSGRAPAGVRDILQDDAFRRRLVQLLQDPLGPSQEAATAAVATAPGRHSEDGNEGDDAPRQGESGTPRERGCGSDAAAKQETECDAEANLCGGRRSDHDDEEEEEEESPRAAESPSAGQAVMAERLTASLALTASDAAARFLEMMRRLWSAYFAHLRAEVRAALWRLDDAFARFEADPSEATLADFLEEHQQLPPLLRHGLGMPEAADEAAALPPGNPLEPEGEVVQQLSLCIAEAVSPLLAVALRAGEGRDGGATRRSLRERRGHGQSPHTTAPPPRPPPLRQRRRAWREERAGSHCSSSSSCCSSTGSNEERRPPALDGGGGASPAPRVRHGAAANYASPPPQQPQLQPQWRRHNDSSQIAEALFSRGTPPGNRVSALAVVPASLRATSEEKVGDAALPQDPNARLRILQMQEERLAFTLVNTAARRHDHGCEVKYYAMNKRLARVRSAILRTEREVDELRRIEEEKAALRRERAARQRRMLRH